MDIFFSLPNLPFDISVKKPQHWPESSLAEEFLSTSWARGRLQGFCGSKTLDMHGNAHLMGA